MSNNKFNSSYKAGNKINKDIKIEDLESSKGLFSNSFKKSNTKQWNINQSHEEVKIGKKNKYLLIFLKRFRKKE